jgi:hypothetical protein
MSPPIFRGGGDGVQRGGLQALLVVFGDYENSHAVLLLSEVPNYVIPA